MKAIGYGVILGGIWLWVYQPLAMAVCGGLLAGGLVGYGLARLSGVSGPAGAVTEDEEALPDPAEAKLIGMGFAPSEVRPLLAKAYATGESDPVSFVMRSLIR